MAADAVLEHVGLCAPSGAFDRMVEFYESVFGWRRFERPSTRPPPYRRAFLADGRGGSVEVFELDHAPIAGANHIALCVPPDRFDDVYQRAVNAGVDIDEPARTALDERYTFLTDPGGNNIQLVGRIQLQSPDS